MERVLVLMRRILGVLQAFRHRPLTFRTWRRQHGETTMLGARALCAQVLRLRIRPKDLRLQVCWAVKTGLSSVLLFLIVLRLARGT